MKIPVTFLLSYFLTVSFSFACTCVTPAFEDQMKTATAVFTARTIRIEAEEEGRLRVDLETQHTWKGPSEKIITIRTADDTAACGYPFEMEKEYLVYARGENELSVSLCSRTKILTEALEDLERLEAKNTSKASRRDPFTEMSGERVLKTEKLVPKALNIKHAVVVGITKKGSEYVALIRATNNKVYFLKVGDKLHDGVVQKIDNNSVTFLQNQGKRSWRVRKQLRPFPDQ